MLYLVVVENKNQKHFELFSGPEIEVRPKTRINTVIFVSSALTKIYAAQAYYQRIALTIKLESVKSRDEQIIARPFCFDGSTLPLLDREILKGGSRAK